MNRDRFEFKYNKGLFGARKERGCFQRSTGEIIYKSNLKEIIYNLKKIFCPFRKSAKNNNTFLQYYYYFISFYLVCTDFCPGPNKRPKVRNGIITF